MATNMLKKLVLIGFLFTTNLSVYPGDSVEPPSSSRQSCRCNVWGAFEFLLNRGCVHPCEYVYSATMYGVDQILYGFSRTLIAVRLIDVNTIDRDGRTALMRAAADGNIVMVDALIAAGVVIDVSSQDGRTALMCASGEGPAQAVKALLVARARIDVGNEMGMTALEYAVLHNRSTVAQMIISEYHRRLPRLYPGIKELMPRESVALIERTLPIECGQEIVRLLSPQEILALRSVSTHCLSYAQPAFEKIRWECATKLKKALIRDIKSRITKMPQLRREKIWIEFLQDELKRARSFNVMTGAYDAQKSIDAMGMQKINEDSYSYSYYDEGSYSYYEDSDAYSGADASSNADISI